MLANNISFDTRITPNIVRFCVGKLKPHKDDGKYGFKSDHLINGTNKLFTVLSIMFNDMLTHGFNPDDLLRSMPRNIHAEEYDIKFNPTKTVCIKYGDMVQLYEHLNTGCTSYAQVSAKHNTQIPGTAIYTDNPDSHLTHT